MSTQIFGEPFNKVTRINAEKIVHEITTQPDEYFEDIRIEEFEDYLVSKYLMFDFPKLIWQEVQVDIGEREVSGKELPLYFDVSDPNIKFKRKVVTFLIPVEGNIGLFRYRPSNVFSTASIYGKISVSDYTFSFSYTDLYNDPEKVESDFEKSKNTVIGKLASIKAEFDAYNNGLTEFVKGEIRKRVQKINQTNDYKSKFKYPIKKKNVPLTFKSPKLVKKRKIIPKPISITSGKSDQRFITVEDYMYLLNRLQECGENWEQHPEIYKGKGEEALRDQLIFALAPIIEGVVAGEAYNKKGKTDIAIKYGTTNLFIGECKIWKGPKTFTDTIDQILGYLTWRDSKAAIMMFVPNQDISNVRDSAANTAKKHPNFVRQIDVINEGWINYKFHIQDDPGTYLSLAVQLYHLPEL